MMAPLQEQDRFLTDVCMCLLIKENSRALPKCLDMCVKECCSPRLLKNIHRTSGLPCQSVNQLSYQDLIPNRMDCFLTVIYFS